MVKNRQKTHEIVSFFSNLKRETSEKEEIHSLRGNKKITEVNRMLTRLANGINGTKYQMKMKGNIIKNFIKTINTYL